MKCQLLLKNFTNNRTHTHICSGKNLETQLFSSGSLLLLMNISGVGPKTRIWKIPKSHQQISWWKTQPKAQNDKQLPPFPSDLQLPKPFHTSSIHLGISMVHSPCSSICRASASFQKISNTSHKFCSKVIQLMVHWWFGFWDPCMKRVVT